MSLKHVTQLDDGLRIDQSFIRDMYTNSSALAVVRLLIHLADGLGVTVTAEGTETAEQLTTLTQLGAGYGRDTTSPAREQAMAHKRAHQPRELPQGDGWVYSSQAARILDLTPIQVTRLSRQGDLAFDRLSGRNWYLRTDVAALAGERSECVSLVDQRERSVASGLGRSNCVVPRTPGRSG